ncbi:MAG: hypothetical protein VYC95_04390, partial [Verrucomicrobiota bacterium]|nr:hypothetical protein [Verrucomicrobiota bacterium]
MTDTPREQEKGKRTAKGRATTDKAANKEVGVPKAKGRPKGPPPRPAGGVKPQPLKLAASPKAGLIP